jgi:hypothetical protein
MNTEEQATEHEICLQILQGLDNLIGEIPGTRSEHQQRVNSLQFILKRLQKLDAIEQAESLASQDIQTID